jgi:AcrR family transcriptional regulator
MWLGSRAAPGFGAATGRTGSVTAVVDGIEAERRSPFGDNPVVGARGARTQRRILTAALDVFAEHGYHDSRIEQITEAAGCSRPTFYQYFSSKEDVFRSLASHVGRSVVQMTEALGRVTPDAPGRAAVVAWMREFSEFYDAFAPVFTGFSVAVRSDRALAGASAPVSAGFGQALRPHLVLDDGAVEPGVMASTIVTMIVRANLLRIGSAGLVGRKRFVEALGATVHRTLVGPVARLDDRAAGPRPARPARLRSSVPDLSPPAGRALSPQGERMRARIVEAGVEVFPKLGYHETRVDDVVAAAGASHGSFYRYFEGKDDLFRVLATEAAEKLIGCIDAFPKGDDAAALHDWLDTWFGLYAEHGGIIGLWRETQFPDPALEALTKRVADVALSRLLDALGERAVGDPLVDAMAFLGLVETVPHHVHAFGYFTQAEAVDALVAIIRRGFLGLPA